jgi:ubiquinone/menaquinone biosynthesis C-methylase UbiE
VILKFAPEKKELLDEPERPSWQDPQVLLNLGRVERGMVVLDVGCGTGFLSFPAARRVGVAGRVLAVDMQKEMIAEVWKRIKREGVKVVVPVMSTEELIPLAADIAHVAFMVNVLHELEGRATLEETYRILRPGGLLVVSDWKKKEMEKGPPVEHRLSEVEARNKVQGVGFVYRSMGEVGLYHYGLVFEKPGAIKRPVS